MFYLRRIKKLEREVILIANLMQYRENRGRVEKMIQEYAVAGGVDAFWYDEDNLIRRRVNGHYMGFMTIEEFERDHLNPAIANKHRQECASKPAAPAVD